ncbi:MAG: DUF3429 domain-containing protein [Burkholderiaceae bacterium]|jgi:hypothetical protein
MPHDPKRTLIDWLGYAGLLPFIVLALLLWLVDADLHPFVALALAAYGAAVVSFLGGIHWGIGLRYAATETPGHAFHLVWGTVPPLLAWVAIMMPAFAGLPLLGLVLVACYAVDRKTWADAGLSHWLPLRWRLTVVATLACVFGAGGT